MKSLKLTALLLIVISTQFFSSCTKDAVGVSESPHDMMAQGNWVVDYYFEGSDKTSQFSSYEFNFLLDASINGYKNGNLFHGKWYIEKDSHSNELLTLNFDEAQLSPLIKQWRIATTGNNSISLIDGGSNQLRLKRKE